MRFDYVLGWTPDPNFGRVLRMLCEKSSDTNSNPVIVELVATRKQDVLTKMKSKHASTLIAPSGPLSGLPLASRDHETMRDNRPLSHTATQDL